MEKRYQVFVSSTYADLKEERQRVIQTLMEIDCIPSGMELFPALDEEQWEFIKKVIDDCDYYLLIIGGRYGSTTAEGISYTEKEYDYAVSKGIRVIALLHGHPDSIPFGKSEVLPEVRERLNSFRNKVARNRLVKFWNTAEELPSLVSISLLNTIRTYPATGWIRGGSALPYPVKETSGFDYDQYIQDVGSSKRLVRVLSTFTELLNRERFKSKFREALDHAMQTRNEISIQFLLLDPSSDAAKQRSDDRKDGNVIPEIRRNLWELHNLKQDPLYNRIDVKIYNTLPPFSLFQWDEQASLSFYPRDMAVSKAARIEILMEGSLGRFISKSFDAVWEDEETKTLEEYMFVRVAVGKALMSLPMDPKVHYVEYEGALCLLLDRRLDGWAWSLPDIDNQQLPLDVYRGGDKLSCTFRYVGRNEELFTSVRDLAYEKYGRFKYEKILALQSLVQ